MSGAAPSRMMHFPLALTVVLLALLALLYGGVWLATRRLGWSRGRRAAAFVGLALGAGYVGNQLLAQSIEPGYRSYSATPTLEEAREWGTWRATYRATPLVTSPLRAHEVFAYVPTRKTLGPLLWPRRVEADAVGVVARLGETGGGQTYYLAFEDGAGVEIGEDGQAVPLVQNPSYGPDWDSCCFAFRSRVPERFWLARGDSTRLLQFDRLPEVR